MAERGTGRGAGADPGQDRDRSRGVDKGAGKGADRDRDRDREHPGGAGQAGIPPVGAEVLTAAQMRAAEGAAMAAGEVTGATLMDRAGQGVVAAILDTWPRFVAPRRALVLCGPGNNGGDGFVVARLLAARGWDVSVHLLGDPARLRGDAAGAAARWTGAVHPLDPARIGAALTGWARGDGEGVDLVVDALFGTGLTRGLDPAFAPLAAALSASEAPKVVAVDIPSGLCADSGRALGPVLPADLTVSFHRAKRGHVLTAPGDTAGGPALRGRLVVADIGLRGHPVPAALHHVAPPARAELAKPVTGHKYLHGHALVLGGGPGRGGAARLACRAALRCGAGLVTLGCPPAALAENAARLDAIMLHPVEDAAALAALLEDPRIGTLCLGPGLGITPRTAALVETVLATRRPAVLDADALTLCAAEPERFGPLLHPDVVMTPHMGEFARLFPDLAADLAAPPVAGPALSRADVAGQAARRAGCVLLLKGADTLIAAPDGGLTLSAALDDQAAPWLATAGAGDVLAGIITGLLARGLPAARAAGMGAWLHGAAARRFGPGLIAEDLPEALPGVFAELGL